MARARISTCDTAEVAVRGGVTTCRSTSVPGSRAWDPANHLDQHQRHGTTLHIPANTRYMECRGHGPITMDSIVKEYRDCTDPDLHKAVTEPWLERP